MVACPLPYIAITVSDVLCGALCCTLTGLGSISLDGAFSPWQWILERLEEIEDAPADNHIIIEAHKTANLSGNERKQQYLSLLYTITVSPHTYKTKTAQGTNSHAVC